MNISLLLLGIAPLVIFAILDSFTTLKAALMGAAIAVAFEAGFSLYLLGEIDKFTIYNTILVLVFAGIAWRLNSSKFFKLQPSIVSTIFGMFLVGSYLLDQPLLSEFMTKYKEPLMEALADQPELRDRMLSSHMMLLFREATFTFGIVHFFHAALTAIAALKYNNFVWLLSRLSIYVFLLIGMVWAQLRL